MFAPLTTEPAAGAELPAGVDDPPEGAPPVEGAAGPVLEQPAMATAITTNMIAMILTYVNLIGFPPLYNRLFPGLLSHDGGNQRVGFRVLL
jgi:hypothetical protein